MVCVFTLKGCSHCENLKERLSKENIQYEEYDIDEHSFLWGQIIEQTKMDTLPTVFFRNEEKRKGILLMPGLNVDDEDHFIEQILHNIWLKREILKKVFLFCIQEDKQKYLCKRTFRDGFTTNILGTNCNWKCCIGI